MPIFMLSVVVISHWRRGEKKEFQFFPAFLPDMDIALRLWLGLLVLYRCRRREDEEAHKSCVGDSFRRIILRITRFGRPLKRASGLFTGIPAASNHKRMEGGRQYENQLTQCVSFPSIIHSYRQGG